MIVSGMTIRFLVDNFRYRVSSVSVQKINVVISTRDTDHSR